jgi:lipopolysaccharide/colanic/teichoic acid biosynthesis glycosyltransferase
VALAVIWGEHMSFNVIDNDKEQLDATRISGRLRMNSNSQLARARRNLHAEELKSAEQVGAEPTQTGRESGRLSPDQIRVTYLSVDRKHRSAAFANNGSLPPRYEVTKRAFDLVFGGALLLVATPIILIAAAAIRLESKGSPFFVQTRLGKNGRPFKIVKLRGMFKDARIRFPSYYDYSNKPDLDFCFHHEVDPRVTRAGQFIRKTSIDELPNLWNVVKGDISLVGPRPEIPEVMALYGTFREEYLSVKPGVTCLSKCTGRDRLTKRETIEYDLDYIRQRNFRMDVRILWRTFRSVVTRRDVF